MTRESLLFSCSPRSAWAWPGPRRPSPKFYVQEDSSQNRGYCPFPDFRSLTLKNFAR
jgi:hypothetical protein